MTWLRFVEEMYHLKVAQDSIRAHSAQLLGDDVGRILRNWIGAGIGTECDKMDVKRLSLDYLGAFTVCRSKQGCKAEYNNFTCTFCVARVFCLFLLILYKITSFIIWLPAPNVQETLIKLVWEKLCSLFLPSEPIDYNYDQHFLWGLTCQSIFFYNTYFITKLTKMNLISCFLLFKLIHQITTNLPIL